MGQPCIDDKPTNFRTIDYRLQDSKLQDYNHGARDG